MSPVKPIYTRRPNYQQTLLYAYFLKKTAKNSRTKSIPAYIGVHAE